MHLTFRNPEPQLTTFPRKQLRARPKRSEAESGDAETEHGASGQCTAERTAPAPDALPSGASRSRSKRSGERRRRTQCRSSRATARRPRSRWCSMARVARTATSWPAADGRRGERSVELAAEDLPQERQRRGREGDALAAGAAEHPALVEVEGHERLLGPAAHAALQLGPDALRGEDLPEEGRHDELRRLRGQRAERAHQHAVEVGHRLPVRRQAVHGLEQDEALRQAIEVVHERPGRVDGLDLADDVQLPALVEQEGDVGQRLQPTAEAALRLPHALRHGPHLPVLGREQHDDAVGLTQLVRADDHRPIAIEAHRTVRSRPLGPFAPLPTIRSAAAVAPLTGPRRRSGARGVGTRGWPRPGGGGGSRARARR